MILFNRHRNKSAILGGILLFLFVLFPVFYFVVLKQAQGATYTWDGGGLTNNWSDCDNWSTNVCPGSGDIALFNSTSSKNADIVSNISVQGITIQSTYAGTITQTTGFTVTIGSSGYSQAGGTFTGGDSTFQLNHTSGSFTLSGGTFTPTSGLFGVKKNLTVSGGNYNGTGKTVTFNGAGVSGSQTVTCNGTLSGSVNLGITTFVGQTFTIASGCEITFVSSVSTIASIVNNGTLNATNITTQGNFTQNGTINLSGTLTFDDISPGATQTLTCSGVMTGLVNVDFSLYNTNVFTLSSNCEATFQSNVTTYGSMIINGTLNATDIEVSEDVTVTGTLNLSGTLTFDDVTHSNTSTLSCSGIISGTVNIVFNSYTDNTWVLGSGCEVTFPTNLSTYGSITNNGTINATNITISGNFTQNGTLNSTGILTLDDATSALTQTITCTGVFPMTVNVKFDGWNNGTFSLVNGCTATLVTGDYIQGSLIINGTLNADSFSLGRSITVNGTLNSTGTLTLDDVTSAITQTITCTGVFPMTVDVKFDGWGDGTMQVASGCEVNLLGSDIIQGSITNNGTLNATNPTLYRNFTQNGTINITGSLTFDDSSIQDSTLTCTTPLNGAVVLNKNSSSSDLFIGSNCTIVGNFTRTDGTVPNPGSAYTLSIQGNFSMSTTDTFGGSNLTLEFSGTNDQTITRNAGTISTPITVNKTSGYVQQASSLTLDSLTIANGEFRNSNQTLTVTNGLTTNDTFTQGTGNVSFGTLTIGAAGTYTNSSIGDIIVGSGGVSNAGILTLGNQNSCPATDSILLTSSSSGVQRPWSGGGTFNIYDTSIQDQGGTAPILARSSTNVSGNGGNWTFTESCSPAPVEIGDGAVLLNGVQIN